MQDKMSSHSTTIHRTIKTCMDFKGILKRKMHSIHTKTLSFTIDCAEVLHILLRDDFGRVERLWNRTPLKNLFDIGKAFVTFIAFGFPFSEGQCWCRVTKTLLVVPENKNSPKSCL